MRPGIRGEHLAQTGFIGMNVPEVFLKIRPGIELGSISDVGCHRENNEDRYEYWESTNDDEFQRKGRLAIVADGMGGYEGGQEASRIAVETIEQVYAEGSLDPQSLLIMGVQSAHQRILEYAIQDPDMQGMGTTCTAIALVDRDFSTPTSGTAVYI